MGRKLTFSSHNRKSKIAQDAYFGYFYLSLQFYAIGNNGFLAGISVAIRCVRLFKVDFSLNTQSSLDRQERIGRGLFC